jgi:hypothetical protein
MGVENLMQVMYLSNSDSGGQGHLLTKAMREVLGWKARTFQGGVSYLGYPHDMIEGVTEYDEVVDFAKNSDFFIMQDQYMGKGTLQRFVTPRNSCIHGLGTPLRMHLSEQLINQLRLHTLIVPPAPDPTITPFLMASAMFESLIVDVNRINELTNGIEKNEELTICCPVSQKKEKFIQEAREQIESLGVKFETVTQTSWEDTIKIKARAHIILDPPSEDVCPSLNTWEAIYMNSIPVGPYSAWGYSIHPELDYFAKSYNPDTGENKTMLSEIKKAINDATKKKDALRVLGKDFVLRYYEDTKVVQRWKWWITWAMRRGM